MQYISKILFPTAFLSNHLNDVALSLRCQISYLSNQLLVAIVPFVFPLAIFEVAHYIDYSYVTINVVVGGFPDNYSRIV